jgi:polar amino acid transport system permease protein
MLLDLFTPLLPGVLTTVELTLAAACAALLIAFVAGLARLSRFRPIRILAGTYVEVFRGSSALVQLYVWYYILPLIGISLSPFPTAVIALGLNEGAYVAEIVRGAITSVDRGQIEAALALNMTRRTTFWRVVLPQALQLMIRPFGNALIDLLKATSLVSFISIMDLTATGQALITRTGNITGVYTLILLIYFALAVCFGSFVTRVIEPLVLRRLRAS